VKNKKILGFLAIFLLILVVAPYFIGNKAKALLEKQAIQISELPGYKLEIRTYDQGWFSSHAEVFYGFDEHTLNILEASIDKKYSFDKSTYKLLKNGFIVDVTVAHGPITFQNGVNFALLTLAGRLQDMDYADFNDTMTKNNLDSMFDLFTSVSYGGTTTIKATVPAFKENDPKIEIGVIFSGMELQATLNAQQDEFGIFFNFPGLEILSPNGDLSLHGITGQATGTKMNDFLWLGKGNFSLGHFKIENSTDGLTLSLNNFSNDYDLSKESDTTLTMRLQSKAGSFVANEDGQDVELADITLDFTLNHLNSEAITDYIKSIKQSYQLTEQTQEQTTANLQAIAARIGEKLLKDSPEMIVTDLGFLMGGGFLKSEAKLSIDGDGLENIQQLSDPIALNKRLVLQVNIKFDKAIANAMTAIGLKKQMAAGGADLASMPKAQRDQMINLQTSTALQTFINQGYLTQEGEIYSLHFDMKNGQRLVNGKPLAIPGM